MLKVNNKKCIRHLADKSFKASRMRNLIAVLAIILTTVLFTTLFTVGFSMNEAFQQSNFRQVGGYAHGSLKNLTKEQYQELKEDPLIHEYGVRRVAGIGTGELLRKNQVEVCWNDANSAKWMWLDPIKGRLPKEGTNEAATDLEVLKLLGVEPKIGEKFILPIEVEGKQVNHEFVLCGWWEKDPVTISNMVLISESQVNEILSDMDIEMPCKDKNIGSWQLEIMFSNDRHIEENLNTILEDHGYQSKNPGQTDTYINTGVNWGYTAAQFSEKADPMAVIGVIVLLILIIFTGYLIIYNVFRISVVNDVRFFGLLKTIGATGKQIKFMIHRQAMLLCILGSPIGCIVGWVIGAKLNPVIMRSLNNLDQETVSTSPLIFIGAAIFTVFTVFISCVRPARLAAKISPVEAVRYTESGSMKKKHKKGKETLSINHMAVINMGRSKGKTFVTILSLTLAVVLLQMTVLFTNGFDMDKYMDDKAVSDFILADGAYFHNNVNSWREGEGAVEPRIIEDMKAHGGITDGGRIYGQTGNVSEFSPEKWIRHTMKGWGDPEESIEDYIKNQPHTQDGRILNRVQTYGMEPYILSRLKVYDGDISSLNDPDSRTVAAVYSESDYGLLEPDSHWAKVGDTVTLRYVTEWEIYDVETGTVYQSEAEAGSREWDIRPLTYHDEVFTVAAVVTVPGTLSYRYYGADEFVMGAETFLQVNQTNDVMLYAFDVEETNDMETFLSNYTSNKEPKYDFESKASYQAEFQKFRSMFLLVGGLLSFIVGLVGILNFLNVILTSIVSRRRELAMLQSIGMTGKQLKKMLVTEGILYASCSLILALIVAVIMGPVAASTLSKMFWFFTYRPSFKAILIVAPVFIIVGALVPLLTYHKVSRRTIVERLRESES